MEGNRDKVRIRVLGIRVLGIRVLDYGFRLWFCCAFSMRIMRPSIVR
jgi:hypothetical protein